MNDEDRNQDEAVGPSDQGGWEGVERGLPSTERENQAYDQPAPPARPPASAAKVWAAVSVASMVIVAAVVITVVLITHHSQTPLSGPATSQTERPTSSSHLTAVPSSPAPSTGVAGLAPFAREWSGMRETIVIYANGHGHYHYMMACPSCTTMAEIPYNTLEFTLTAVSGGTASGTITKSSDPQFPAGEPVAATLAPPDTIHWMIGGKDAGLFCGSNPAYCGG